MSLSNPFHIRPQSSMHPWFDRNQVRDSVAQDDELLTEVLRTFLEECPGQLDRMQMALETDDRSTVELMAHTLKGTLRIVGTAAAVQVAWQVERAARAGIDERLTVRCLKLREIMIQTMYEADRIIQNEAGR